MIPNMDNIVINFEVMSTPTLTYQLRSSENRISGKVDDIEAIRQAIYLMLNTERYDYVIYSWRYGIELNDLYGGSIFYAKTQLQDRITKALKTDDRISDVKDFEITSTKNTITAKFTVVTVFGNVDSELEVTI